jgi:hypothetical protein
MSLLAVMLSLHVAQSSSSAAIPKLVQTLTEEAAAFARCASRAHTEETLAHKALQGNGKWKEATVVSSYSFASPRDRSSAVREIRLIRSVNGRPVKQADSLDLIAMSVAGGSDKDRRKTIEQLEKQGVSGVATDLGQLLLLFSESSVGNYEFTPLGVRTNAEGVSYAAYSFRQIDGKEAMTVFRAGKVAKPKLDGEVWIRAKDSKILRVALSSVVPGSDKLPDSRQEMAVDYSWSMSQGCSLPASAAHREYQGTGKQVENLYSYKPYEAFR